MKISDVKKALRLNKLKRKPSILLGPPGTAKTQVLGQFAHEEKAGHLLVKVSQLSELEFKGLPDYEDDPELKEPLGVGRASIFVPGMFVKRAWQLYRKHGSVHITFDEAGNARGPVQVAMYEALESFSLGGYEFPPNTFIGATSNRMEDQSGTFKLVPPLVNRAWIVTQEVELEEWIRHFLDPAMGYARPLHPAMAAWHRFTRGEKLHTWDPKRYLKEYPFGSPRSYAAASETAWIAEQEGYSKEFLLQFLAGEIGSGEAADFVAFIGQYQNLPTREEVESKPEGAKVPKDNNPSGQYAVASALTTWADPKRDNFGQILTYMNRLPKTFQYMIVDDLTTRYPSDFILHPQYTKWLAANAHRMV